MLYATNHGSALASRHALLLASIAGSALWLWATPAYAAPEQPAADQSPPSGAIEEIIVTANRREQNSQSVPIAISAIGGDAALAKGINGIAALQNTVPSLIVARQANMAQPFLRGLGSSSGAPNSEPSVALYVDGVYNPSPNANFFDFNNVERIEVLKGPQGTLFGRNATGGVVQIITKDPSNRVEGEFRAGYANYNTVTAQAYLSAPITDTLGANIAVLYKKQHDGWGRNLFTNKDTVGDDNIGVRGKIVWRPDDATDIKLSFDYSHTRNSGINGQAVPPSRSLNFPVILATGIGDPYPGNYNVNSNLEMKSDVESGGASLKIDHDFGGVQLMSLSAYRKSTGFWTYDQDLSPWRGLDAQPNQFGRMYSQEVHLLSPSSSKLQWLVGAYYFNYNAGHNPLHITGILLDPTFPGCIFAGNCNETGGLDIYGQTRAKSYSIFGQGTYPLGDSTNITVGARYTWDRVGYQGKTTVAGTDILVPGIGGPATGNFRKDAPTFRISLDHKFTPDIMGYISYNQGTKSGGFDVSIAVQPLASTSSFAPEKVNAFEAGLKTEMFDRKMRLNVAGFYYDFKNMQFQKIVAGSGVTFNAPNGAEMYGVEADMDFRVTSQLRFTSGIGYLHTRIRDFAGAPNTCLSSVTGLNDNGGFVCNGADGLPDPANLIPYNAKGNRTPNSPAWTGNAAFTYTIPASFGTFDITGSTSYTSKYYFEVDNRTVERSRWLMNGSIRWADQRDAFSVLVWGRNLTNRYYYTQYTGQGGASDVGAPGSPREYGITVGYKF